MESQIAEKKRKYRYLISKFNQPVLYCIDNQANTARDIEFPEQGVPVSIDGPFT